MNKAMPHPVSLQKLRSMYVDHYDKTRATALACSDKDQDSIPKEAGNEVFWILNISQFDECGQTESEFSHKKILFQGRSLSDLEKALHRHADSLDLDYPYDVYVNDQLFQHPTKAYTTFPPSEYDLDWAKLPLTTFFQPGDEISVQLTEKGIAL